MIINIDPHGMFPNLTPYQAADACGFLLGWIQEAEVLHTEEAPVTMKDRLLENYVYYMGEMTGGELTSDGIFKFEGAPDMFPFVRFEFNSEVCFIFQFSIVGIINADGSTFVTRMN